MNTKTSEIRLRVIGVIRSPFHEPSGTPIQAALAGDAEGSVEVLDELAAGLPDLAGFDRIWLVYWFHRAEWKGDLVLTPFLDTQPRSLFATRAPLRPNPIGLSPVRLLGIEGNVLHIQGVDVLDGTPLLDIKPYAPRFDSFPEARAGWLDASQVESTVSDRRFHKR